MKNKKQTNYPLKTVTIDGMGLYELCRWAALKEAIDIVGDKCDERNIDFSTFDLRPLDLLHYVDHATDDIYSRALNNQ